MLRTSLLILTDPINLQWVMQFTAGQLLMFPLSAFRQPNDDFAVARRFTYP